MENRLQSHPEINDQYYDFLYEYFELGHMEPVMEGKTPVIQIHSALSLFTIQTVLQNYASCKTRNGTSLNNHLLIGSKLPVIIAR
jgi:hypothetical protein